MRHEEMFRLAQKIYAFFKSKQVAILGEYMYPSPLREKSPGDYIGKLDDDMHNWLSAFLPTILSYNVLSEEGGQHNFYLGAFEDCYCWVIDPVDGTHNKEAKMSFGHQLALIQGGRLVFSAIYVPMDEEATWDGFFFAGRGCGAWQRTPNGYNPLRISGQKDLERAHLLLEGKSKDLRKHDFLNKVALAAERNHNGLSYAYSTTRLLLGSERNLPVDILIGLNGKPWDTLPAISMFEEAGGIEEPRGVVVGWDGNPWSFENCSNLIFGNQFLRRQVLALKKD